MIAFDLQCENDHCFEGWFEDGKSYEDQKEKGLISCPVCNSSRISKLPSTFAIKGSQSSALNGKPKIDLEKIGKKIVDYVNSFDNVGPDFANEALKMHYGVSEQRNIRGVSTPKEEETLKSEGIPFFKFPSPSDPKEPEQE